jgi:hypothetical protein
MEKLTETFLFGGEITHAPAQFHCTGAWVKVLLALNNRGLGLFGLLDTETTPRLDDRHICSSATLH